VLDRGERTIRAGSADGAEARALGVPVGAPVLRFQRVSYQADRPVEFAVSVYRGDRYEFRAALTVPAGPRAPGPSKEDSHEPSRRRGPARGSRPLLLLLIGVVYAVIYYAVFSFLIRRFDLPTPDREPEAEMATDVTQRELGSAEVAPR
jgi:UTRA domain